MTKKYIYGPGIDNPIVMINVSGTTETWYYYYTDALGSVRLITDHEGTIKEGYTYDPFGWPRVMTSGDEGDGNWLTEDTSILPYSSLGNPYMFTARRWDFHALLYYYRFRDYHPKLGRFCQPDPIGYWDSMNLYHYCLNNPINWIDPWGLVPFDPELVFPIDVEPAYEALISFGHFLKRGAIELRKEQLMRKAQKLHMRSQIFEGLSSMFYTTDEWLEYPGPYVDNVEPIESIVSFHLMVLNTFPWDDLSERCFDKSLDYDKKVEQILEEIRDLTNPDNDSETKSEPDE